MRGRRDVAECWSRSLIVVDTSAALAALFGQAPARDALVGQRLLAPHVIDAEIAHALRGLVLGGKVTAW